MVCAGCSETDTVIEQGLCENGSWQMTFLGAETHLSRGTVESVTRDYSGPPFQMVQSVFKS